MDASANSRSTGTTANASSQTHQGPKAVGSTSSGVTPTSTPGVVEYIHVLGPHDICCGRGTTKNRNPGNVLFRQIVSSRKFEYISTSSRKIKAKIAQELVHHIKYELDPPGRFLTEAGLGEVCGMDCPVMTGQVWAECSDAVALEKTRQALRRGASSASKDIKETASTTVTTTTTSSVAADSSSYPLASSVSTSLAADHAYATSSGGGISAVYDNGAASGGSSAEVTAAAGLMLRNTSLEFGSFDRIDKLSGGGKSAKGGNMLLNISSYAGVGDGVEVGIGATLPAMPAVPVSNPFHVEEVVEDAFSVPKFTAEDEQRELSTLTMDEIIDVDSDVRGISAMMAGMSVGTQQRGGGGGSSNARTKSDEELSKDMARLAEEIGKCPEAERAAFMMAMERCPDEVLGGWRGEAVLEENFDRKTTAKNLLHYWNKRLALFGENRCFLPMTLAGAMQDEVAAMMLHGIHRISPAKDSAGRIVVFIEPARRDRRLYSTKSQNMAWWYIMEIICQDVDARQRGVVMLFSGKGVLPTHFDPNLVRLGIETFDIFPTYLRVFIFCHPNPIAKYVIFPALRWIVGRHTRQRIRDHSGSTEDVLSALNKYCLPPDRVPKELGGAVKIDILAWVQERYSKEGSNPILEQFSIEPAKKRSRALASASSTSSCQESVLSPPMVTSANAGDDSNKLIRSGRGKGAPMSRAVSKAFRDASRHSSSKGYADGATLLQEDAAEIWVPTIERSDSLDSFIDDINELPGLDGLVDIKGP